MLSEDMMTEFGKIGYGSVLARTATQDILDSWQSNAKLLFRQILLVAYFLFITVASYYLLDLKFYVNVIFLLSFGVALLYVIYRTMKLYSHQNLIRERFTDLYEKPTIENCEDIIDELTDEGIL